MKMKWIKENRSQQSILKTYFAFLTAFSIFIKHLNGESKKQKLIEFTISRAREIALNVIFLVPNGVPIET